MILGDEKDNNIMKNYYILATIALFPNKGNSAIDNSNDIPNNPNIILIIADDMGYGDAGYLGATDVLTPNIDFLAKNGVQFEQGYVSCSISGPSRAGILTGVYQQRFGFYNNLHRWAKIPDNQSTLGEIAQSNNYVTGFVGKWHMADIIEMSPNKRGFDFFYGFWSDTHDYYRSTNKANTELYDFCPLYRNEKIQESLQNSGEYLTNRFTNEAVKFINKNSSNPFLLCLAYNAVHSPWQVPEEYVNRLDNIKFHHKDRKVFAGMLLAMDDGIGDIIKALRNNNLEENTFIIFISDNGSPRGQGIECSTGYDNKDRGNTTMSNPGKLRGYKGDTYEGGIRVPFIMYWPKGLPKGVIYNHPVISLDIVPTIMSAIGKPQIKEEYTIDGVNLLPFLKKKEFIDCLPHNTLYWRRDEDFAIREGDWKLTYNDQGSTRRIQLFNIKNDPEEIYDLSDEYSEIADNLLYKFDKWDSSLPQCTNQTTWNGRVIVIPKEPQPSNRNFKFKEGFIRKVSDHNNKIYNLKYKKNIINQSNELPYLGK